ncbi:MAG: hypothetical protein GEV10_26225 [Streptosporangiales bacterium]|nr:hypothetical protein [Streptosporangiales bacterium]
MRRRIGHVLVAGVVLFMAMGVAIVVVQLIGLVLLDGNLLQAAVDVLGNYAFIPAAGVSVLAYLLDYGSAPAPDSGEETWGPPAAPKTSD